MDFASQNLGGLRHVYQCFRHLYTTDVSYTLQARGGEHKAAKEEGKTHPRSRTQYAMGIIRGQGMQSITHSTPPISSLQTKVEAGS